ncbi:MFS transporter [Streptomyces caelestis]|uniref:MFS transporter n=1 Tax=Streptomyces caelestis TaxID=36816 RepID=UPI0036F956C7
MTEHRTGTRPGAAVTVTGAALGVDMFLYGCIVPLLPGLPAVDGSPLTAGVLFAVYAAALLAATPFIGVWVDRRGPRTPMLAGLLGLAAATVLFAWAVDVEADPDSPYCSRRGPRRASPRHPPGPRGSP